MHNHHNRSLKINKKELISKIEENKKIHIKEFNDAVKAYKVEAKKQINEASTMLKEGNLKLKLNLITPVNREDEYDKVIEMFKWEQDDVIEITQDEFNEYVHDDNNNARNAKILNTSYLSLKG